MSKQKFEKEIKAKIEEAKQSQSKSLLGVYILGYSLRVKPKDRSENDHEVWSKMSIPKAMFDKVGFAASLAKTTKRLKHNPELNRDHATKDQLIELIKESPNMILFHDPNSYRKSLDTERKKAELEAKKLEEQKEAELEEQKEAELKAENEAKLEEEKSKAGSKTK